MRTPGAVAQTAADTELPRASLVPTARSPPPRPPIQSTKTQGIAPRNLQAASNTHLHEAPAGSTALGPAPSGPVGSFFRPAFPLPSRAEVTAERCDWAAWRRGSGCLCCQKAEASHPGFWRPNSLQLRPLTVLVCTCHLPAFCDGAELRTAVRMGPPELRERRVEPGGEGGAAGCRLGSIRLACRLGLWGSHPGQVWAWSSEGSHLGMPKRGGADSPAGGSSSRV